MQADGRVLSTLEGDGSRRWLYPRLSRGTFWRRRRLVAYSLIAVYTLLPFISIGGRPAMQLDLSNGRFSFFGLVFLPNELKLLAIFGIIVVLSIFFATAIFGRVWCGWGCPQTIYLEYVFRPIERLFTGVQGKGGQPRRAVAGWRRPAMYAVYLLICWHLANTFLAYFVGAETLHAWIWSAPPWQHPGAFALVLFVTGLMMFDFCYWREQLCIIGCPYGRFQSVMLDRSSLVVGYDQRRGEPRGRGRQREAKGLGDCIDCGMCVAVCPTGIDIRDGLQMECVNCTQCIDACDDVMDRVKQPRGLIRYSSQDGLDGRSTALIRPRVLVYAGVIAAAAALLAVMLVGRSPFHVTLMRGMGPPFSVEASGGVENLVRIKIVNRTDAEQAYRVAPIQSEGVRLVGDGAFVLPPQASVTETLHLVASAELFAQSHGLIETTLQIADGAGHTQKKTYRLFGPSTAPTAQESP
ncbi:MAG: cytochrome c oxidase accessory protein CcoG [Planctomycetota bacterium]